MISNQIKVKRWCSSLLFLLLIYVLSSIVLPNRVLASCNILSLRAEMNSFERSTGLQASFRVQSLTFWNCSRNRCFKFNSGLPNISEQYLLKAKNCGVHNTSRMFLLNLLEYKRPPSLEGLQGLQTFANINSRMVSRQASV